MDIFDIITKTADAQITKAMREAITFAKKKIEEKTPEDTKKLVGDYKIEPLEITNKGIYSQKVVNKTPYASYVEYGVKSAIYMYNKPKGNIFKVGVGARMITLTKEEDGDEINNIIRTKLIKYIKII